MARTKSQPTAEVSIYVDGDRANEYPDPEVKDTPDSVTRYIETQTGQHFEIHVSIDLSTVPRGLRANFEVYVNGKWSQGIIMEDVRTVGSHVFRGEPIDATTIKLYGFKDLRTVHKPSDAPKENPLVGCITINLWHYRSTGRAEPSFNSQDIDDTVTEKFAAKHTLSQSIALMEQNRHETKSVLVGEGVGEKLAQYNFLYRSKSDLQSLLIVR